MSTLIVGIIIGLVAAGFLLALILGLCLAASRTDEVLEQQEEEERQMRWDAGIGLLNDLNELEQYNKQKQWDKLFEVSKQETLNDVEHLR